MSEPRDSKQPEQKQLSERRLLPRGQKAILNDPETAGKKIQELFDSGNTEGFTAIVYDIVSDREAKAIMDAAGLEVNPGAEHVITADSIKYAIHAHGGKREALRGQTPILRDDFANIPKITRPENIIGTNRNKRGNVIVKYSKRFNGNTIIVEEYRNKRGQLAFVTMWKTTGGAGSTGEAMPPEGSQPLTSETLRCSAPPDRIIGKDGEKVNESGGKSPRIVLRPRVTVGLLTWNAGQSGAACVRSLLAQTDPVETIWIDNASTDHTVELIHSALRTQDSGLRTQDSGFPSPIINSHNLGFCVGHNQALARCKTPYYLALNQDVILAPDYVKRLCDWMDEDPRLALVSGLILRGETADPAAPIWSAGLVWPRVEFPFELRMGRPPRPEDRVRRRVPGVTGAAMLLRVEACRGVSIPPAEIFPAHFFAYHEEVDLAIRLARAGLACGVDGQATAWHIGGGSGGLRNRSIRSHYFTNHWLLPPRHQPWSMIVRGIPYRLRGELQYWLPRYLKSPLAAALGFCRAIAQLAAARRHFHEFERRHGPTDGRMAHMKRQALEILRMMNDE